MAISVAELKRWLDTLPEDGEVAVDGDGLSLVLDGSDGDVYLEVGGETKGDAS